MMSMRLSSHLNPTALLESSESGYTCFCVAAGGVLCGGKKCENASSVKSGIGNHACKIRARYSHENCDHLHRPDADPHCTGCPKFFAEMADVAPTILHLTGQAVPDDMDGKVLSDIFEPEFMQANPVKSVAATSLPEYERKNFSQEETDEIANRLRSLGYLE